MERVQAHTVAELMHRRRAPGCALLDIHMPGLTGLHDSGFLLPVVFITAGDDADAARGALEAGGIRVLRKPFGNRLLLEALSAALGHRPGPVG